MSGAFVWGKLPAHGDFVARGLTPATRDELDGWLAASLAEARAALGEAFEATYDEAPPWRFTWRDEGGVTAGAMAMSVDAVGRRYPILIAREGLEPEEVDGATEAVEELLYDALADGWDADRLHLAVAAMAPPRGEPQEDEAWWTLGAERFTPRRLAGARPDGMMTAVLTPHASNEGGA